MEYYRNKDGGAILTKEKARQEWRERYDGDNPLNYLRFYEQYEEVHEDGRPVVTEIDRALCLHYGDKKYKYQLLDRLRSDCEYFLNAGNRQPPKLWAGSVPAQLDAMRRLYDSFPKSERPEWLTAEQIEDYARRMTEAPAQQGDIINE